MPGPGENDKRFTRKLAIANKLITPFNFDFVHENTIYIA